MLTLIILLRDGVFNMNQKEIEERCFNDMMLVGIRDSNKRGKHILKRFSGDHVIRGSNDRPDFLIKLNNRNGHLNTLIGVEHFEVDHTPFRKKGSYQSGYKRHMTNIYNAVDPQLGEFTMEKLDEFNDLLLDRSNMSFNKSYGMLMNSFHWSFDKHYFKIDEYRQNILNYSESDVKVELAFMIEMYVDFNDMSLFNKTNGYVQNIDTMPMFREMIDVLSEVDFSKLNYVIFVIRSKYNHSIRVIPLNLRYLYQDLLSQDIYLYEYLGFDSMGDIGGHRTIVDINPYWDKVNGMINLDFTVGLNPNITPENIMGLLLNIKDYVDKDINFVTDSVILNIWNDIKDDLYLIYRG